MINKVPWAAEFEAAVETIMKTYDAPGLAVAFAQNGELVYARGFGYADREAGRPMTEDAIFGIASISKQFTAAAIMQLQEAGKLSVLDPVIKWLPEFKVPSERATKAITIQDFLVHTSGLPPLPLLDWAIEASQVGDPLIEELKAQEAAEAAKKAAAGDKSADKPADKPAGEQAGEPHPKADTYEDVLNWLARGEYELTGMPGQWMSYSNDAYGLLGLIIERASGQKYEDYMDEHIFRAAGLNQTTLSLAEARRRGQLVQLYATDKADKVRPSPQWEEFPAIKACGGIRSTMLDLVKYGQMYLNGGVVGGRRILSEASVARMTKPIYHYSRRDWYGYGLGFRPDYHGVTLIGHSGGLKGVSSYLGFIPETGFVGAVDFNLGGLPSTKVWLAAANLSMGLPVDTKWSVEPEYAAKPEELPRMTGLYVSGEGARVEIKLVDGKLVVQAQEKQYPARASGPNTVVYTDRGIDAAINLITDENNEVYAAMLGSRFVRKSKS